MIDLSALNDSQKEAVRHSGPPLLILAGAGSGKTRVITTKIAYFIREKNINPRSILAVTFTNKAAREMAGRAARLEESSRDSVIRTFHSFGAWFLRRNAEAAGLSSNFIIYDDDDAVSLLSAIFPNKKKGDLRIVAHKIARAKDRNLGPESESLDIIDSKKEFRAIYQKYEERLRQTGNVDFGDLIKKPVEVLRSDEEIARRIRGRFRIIMVDEYQDANIAQAELLSALYDDGTYLCVVGDDDQSIYRFRGAEVKNILDFPNLFGGADIIKLEENYRSTGEILGLAHSVVRNNSGRHGKKLVASRGAGFRPKLYFLNDQEEEAYVCASLIQKSRIKGSPYADWAILYRTNAQSLTFETEFVRRKIPYKVVGSLKFYEREEIKDALAILSFMINPKDEVSFRRVINKPARGLGPASVEKILEERWNERDWNIETALERLKSAVSAKARAGIEKFCSALNKGRAALSEEKRPAPDRKLKAGAGLSVCVATLMEESGIADYHALGDEISGEQRVANLQELVNTAILYEASEAGLGEFLEHIELDRNIERGDDTEDRVTLITLHNTKGLEFKRVVMTGMEQGLFPRADKYGDDLEEERRLFYVGVTRAMDELYLTTCASRRSRGRTDYPEPSIFLAEADASFLNIEGAAPSRFKKNISYAVTPHTEAAGKKQKSSSDGRWSTGDRVFNDDYGYGEVIAIKEGEAGPEITVFLETGRSIKFLSKVQSKNYMKIKD